jgi:prepilin signal peptidase PulO-like enzyme (type II secretory pathway)
MLRTGVVPRGRQVQRRGWFGFASDSLSQTVGTLLAAGVIYLIGISGGVIKAVPVATVLSVVGVAVGTGAAIVIASRARLLLRRADKLLRREPDRVAEGIKAARAISPIVGSEVSNIRIAEALAHLPDREREILALRFGEPMTLEAIGESLGLTRERVRQLESQGLARIQQELEDPGKTG